MGLPGEGQPFSAPMVKSAMKITTCPGSYTPLYTAWSLLIRVRPVPAVVGPRERGDHEVGGVGRMVCSARTAHIVGSTRGRAAARASAQRASRQGAQAIGDPAQGLVDVVPFDADTGEGGVALDPGTLARIALVSSCHTSRRRLVTTSRGVPRRRCSHAVCAGRGAHPHWRYPLTSSVA
jgi:hypothetical protein